MKKMNRNFLWIVIFLAIVVSFFVFQKIFNTPNKLFSEKIQKSTFILPNQNKISTPSSYCNIKDFGAIAGDTEHAKNNRNLIQNVINECVDENHALFIPPGTWFTGGLYFNKNSWLIISKDATLTFAYNPSLYLPLRPSRFEGYDLMNFAAPLYFNNISAGGITGGGKIQIDRPQQWHIWDKHETAAKDKLLQFSQSNISLEQRIFGRKEDGLRPPFIQLYNVANFAIDDIVIQDSTMWTIHALYSNNLLFQNLNISTNGSNTDGIVIDSTTDVIIQDNTLQTGDDAIVLKSGADHDGRRISKPTKNIFINQNTINDAHGSVVIGSEMSGGIEDIFIQNTTITKADIGLRIKTRPGRGGYVRNIYLDTLHAQKLRDELIRINAHYKESHGDVDLLPDLYPKIENINIKNVFAQKTKRTFVIDGLKNDPIQNLLLKNITSTQKKSSKIQNVTEPNLLNIQINFLEDALEDSLILIN